MVSAVVASALVASALPQRYPVRRLPKPDPPGSHTAPARFGNPRRGVSSTSVAGDIDHVDPHARAHDFSVETRADDGVSIVTVVGQADLHTAPDLRAVLGDVVDGGSRAVLVDLTGATFIDSMTLGVLLGALKRLASVDGRLALVCPDEHVRRVFEITSLDRVFTIVDSPPQATALLRDGSA